MIHNEIEQSVLTAQKLALASLRKDGLVFINHPIGLDLKRDVNLEIDPLSDKDIIVESYKLEVTIKFTIEV